MHPDSAEIIARGERAERELQQMSREACLATAAMLREVIPKLAGARQRELAEEMAQDFEARALDARPAAAF